MQTGRGEPAVILIFLCSVGFYAITSELSVLMTIVELYAKQRLMQTIHLVFTTLVLLWKSNQACLALNSC
jgi:hypothetical protein